MINRAPDFALSPDSSTLVEIVRSYPNADLVLKDYFEAIHGNEPYRARVALMLGMIRPDASRLSTIRRNLSTIPDGELSWVNDIISDRDLERRILAYRQGMRTLSIVPTPGQVHWYDALISSLKAQNAEEATFEAVSIAYNKLGNPFSYRLRNIWATQPETLDDFCTDVDEFHGSEAFRFLISNSFLFAGYKEKLAARDEDFRQSVRQIISSKNSNPYAELLKLLAPDAELLQRYVEEDTDVETVEPSRVKYGRIIIWGGQYSREAKERIKAAVPDTPVEVFDLFNRKRDVEGLGSSDAVIWLTKSNEHPSYYLIKGYCKSHGIGFYHFNRSGYQSLIDFLGKLSAPGGMRREVERLEVQEFVKDIRPMD